MNRTDLLLERFSRAHAHRPKTGEPSSSAQPTHLNQLVREYYCQPTLIAAGRQWLARPELPTSDEVLDKLEDPDNPDAIIEITPNRYRGAWASKDEYLSTQYELLREDALRPLREVIAQIKQKPTALEESIEGTPGIYEKVHICGLTCSSRGIALRITFSLFRTGKKIIWEQSKRLITGSLVVLTPSDDMFQQRAIVATVAARPIAGLIQNPPEIDLFIARPDEINIDPAVEYVMVEERSGFYEADRHTLMALQHMASESFPLAKHLVGVEQTTHAPQHVQDRPLMNLTSVLVNNKNEKYEQVNVLQDWPEQPPSELDATQLTALRHILTKDLAIVQGPPGTGKTFVSVQALKVMLQNRQEDDPPIVIACQTNHAVDQILRHIAAFEPDFIRLGGQTKDREIIKARTLYEVRNATSNPPPAGCLAPLAGKRMRALEKEISVLLAPLKPGKTPLDPILLQGFGILTAQQAESLIDGAKEWIHEDPLDRESSASPFRTWLGSNLIPVPHKQQPEDFGYDFEEVDLEFEQLKEVEAENATKDDEDFELSGNIYPLADNYTCKDSSDGCKNMTALMSRVDMWKIPPADRPAVYRHLQSELKRLINEATRDKLKAYDKEAMHRKIGNWEKDETILREQKIIGMTTTGLSKYRGLLFALQPRIVLIEEAAETLEAPVAVACLPSLQQLILVGDHQQLRPHCHVKEHEGKPYYLNVSLFERMVKNGVEYDALRKQRRMIPEVRRVLFPIYKDLIQDHPSVSDPARRPNVPGMGGINSFFFSHGFAEQRDDTMSSYNPDEAEMIAGMVEYLYHNGMPTTDITVLTFYNGQRKKILSTLRQRPNMYGRVFNVVTVDSYQGEENKVVLLSLVRSNDKGQIGFLANKNRVCVALSRAQCGFYIFGNGQLLYGNKTWHHVIHIVANKEPGLQLSGSGLEAKRLVEEVPVTCTKHGKLTKVACAAEWPEYGGCGVKCPDALPCGHPCPLTCHAFEHDMINCMEVCTKNLPCGHGLCSGKCGDPCECSTCKVGPSYESSFADNKIARVDAKGAAETWQMYAMEEAIKSKNRGVATESKENKPVAPKSAMVEKTEMAEKTEIGEKAKIVEEEPDATQVKKVDVVENLIDFDP